MTTIIAGTEHEKAEGFLPNNLRAFESQRSYRTLSTAWVVPMRDENLNIRVVGSWMTLEWPENQSRSGLLPIVGLEVGAAYERGFEICLDREKSHATVPQYGDALANARFIVTSETDNILPPKAFKQLLSAIHECPDCGGEISGNEWKCASGHRGYDALSGLYFIKSDPPIPMAFGDPSIPGDMRPLSVEQAIHDGKVIEVNGIAMGCAVWRKEVFAKVSRPWFETTPTNTQDIFFCKKAKEEAGARFGVHCGVKVGHYDAASGRIF